LTTFEKNRQYFKFCSYGFLKNLRFFDAFLLLFFLENNISFSQIGILYAVREITINISEIPSGFIADIYGRKNSLLLAFGLYISSFLVYYFSINFSLLLMATLLYGIGDAFRSGTHKGMIIDYLKLNNWSQHKVAYYGLTRSWSQKGSALSALLAGIMVFYTGGYRVIFIISTLPYLLNFMNIYTYPDVINFSSKKNKKERKTYKTIFKNFWDSIRRRKTLELVNSSALHSAFLKSIKDYIQPLMVNLAIFIPFMASMDVKRKSGLIIGICYFFIFLITSQASKYAFKLSSWKISNIEKKTLLLGLFSGIVCGMFFHYQLWIVSLILFVLIYFIENIRKPILTGLLADNVPNEVLTSVLSAQSFYNTLVTSVLAIFIGVMADFKGIGISLLSVSLILFFLTFAIKKVNTSA